MGLWGGSNQELSVAEQEMAIAEKMATRQLQKEEFVSGAKTVGREAAAVGKSVAGVRARRDIGFEVGRAAGVGMRQRPSFSREQEMLGEMFGQGDKIWGTNNEPVRINNDLNSSRSDPFDETSSMFGFGDRGERSGLF